MSFSLPEPAHIRVAGAGIDHSTLAVGFVVRPGTGIGVTVGEGHGAVAGFGAGGEVADVGVARKGDVGTRAMGAAGGLSGGEVGGGEVGGGVVTEGVSGVVVAAEVVKVGNWGSAFAGDFEACDPEGTAWSVECCCHRLGREIRTQLRRVGVGQ